MWACRRGQMGNSEVGHTNIGAGRVVAMDLGQIDLAIEDGSFFKSPPSLDFTDKLKASGGTAHLMGLVSDGGVHGHLDHIVAAAKALADRGVPVVIHAITDGRDVAPTSALAFCPNLKPNLPEARGSSRCRAAILPWTGTTAGTGSKRPMVPWCTAKADADGRRRRRWMLLMRGTRRMNSLQPTVIGDYAGMKDGDGVFCLNFRADRAREILAPLAHRILMRFDAGGGPKLGGDAGDGRIFDAHNAYMTTVFPKQKS